ncbi:phosphodiesterase [Reticulomyxa filosa]|uniref:Phosphodiesterase n=1 Tax=Reticulomyxa filosa TaxID=46433 RepID=X6MY44_RETFI|nr:phosphodiesterase [Reticulomyxa filosa]|eukprot:ETO18761.1 phosphodiesterase [Reticulomyxa filosa]
MSKHKRQQEMLAELIDDLTAAGVDLDLWGQSESDNERDDDYVNEDEIDVQKAPNLGESSRSNLSNQRKSISGGSGGQLREPSVFDNKQQLAIVLIPLAVHTADLSNPAKPLPIYQIWAGFVMEEFWLQGDREKEKGVPVTQVCDREKTDLPTCQTGFINHVIKPWFDLWRRLLPEKHAGPLFLQNVNDNLEFMKKELERHKMDNDNALSSIKEEKKDIAKINPNSNGEEDTKQQNKEPESKLPHSEFTRQDNQSIENNSNLTKRDSNRSFESKSKHNNREVRSSSVMEATFDDILKSQYQKQQRDMEEIRKKQMQLDEGTQIDETEIDSHHCQTRATVSNVNNTYLSGQTSFAGNNS